MFIICIKFDDKLVRVIEFIQCNSFVGICMYGLYVWFDENLGYRYNQNMSFFGFLKYNF